VASARHADVVLITGVVTRNMLEPLRRTVEATPNPRVVLAVGDCARNCGVFSGGIGVAGAAHDAVDVDLAVPGCPPEPDVIVEALRRVTRR
jgi:Ni,Fe-hydrogenase III small subunit